MTRVRAAPTTSTGSSTRRPSRVRPTPTTAWVWSRVATSWRGCADKTVDLSLARTIRLGGSRQLQFRVDAFNAFNVAIINARSTTITYNDPVNRVVQNPQYNADGSLNTARLTPRTAGFGAATGAQNMRNFQAMIRFQF